MTYTGETMRGDEIGDRIGSGGYGEVYRAAQLSVDRNVAIKARRDTFKDEAHVCCKYGKYGSYAI